MHVLAIHDAHGYRDIRRALGRQYDVAGRDRDSPVVDFDLAGDRRLQLRHHVAAGAPLAEYDARRVLPNLADLWAYEVRVVEAGEGTVHAEHAAGMRRAFLWTAGL